MKRLVRSSLYLAVLKWKQGEIRSLGTFRGSRSDLAVLFDIPPAGDYDHELKAVLEPTEYLKQFGSRLEKACGKRGVFIDAVQVDDERHRAELSVHPLTELLERARLAEGMAYPVTGPGRSIEYQEAVRRFAQFNPDKPIGIRLNAAATFDDFAGLVRDVRLLMFELGITADRCFLVVDFGAFEPHDIEAFAKNVAERLNNLPYLHDWLHIAVAMTSFPKSPKISAGSIGAFKRAEWEFYKRLRTLPLLRMPIFGDYGLENPAPGVVGRISPVAQCRYSTEDYLFIFKGKSTKKPNGYQAIYPVAEMLVGHEKFFGAEFSLGDEYFHQLATIQKSPGNASTWRWAATDHHLTQCIRSLRTLVGLPAEEVVPVDEAMSHQLDLLEMG